MSFQFLKAHVFGTGTWLTTWLMDCIKADLQAPTFQGYSQDRHKNICLPEQCVFVTTILTNDEPAPEVPSSCTFSSR